MSYARIRALIVAGLLTVAAAVSVVVALARDSQGGAGAGGCPDGAVMANVTLPDDAQQVTVKVYNGSKTPGRAAGVTTTSGTGGSRPRSRPRTRAKSTTSRSSGTGRKLSARPGWYGRIC